MRPAQRFQIYSWPVAHPCSRLFLTLEPRKRTCAHFHGPLSLSLSLSSSFSFSLLSAQEFLKENARASALGARAQRPWGSSGTCGGWLIQRERERERERERLFQLKAGKRFRWPPVGSEEKSLGRRPETALLRPPLYSLLHPLTSRARFLRNRHERTKEGRNTVVT